MSGEIGRETGLPMRAGLCACPDAFSVKPAVTAEATADLMNSLRSIVSPFEVLMVDSKPIGKLQICQREWGAMSRARHYIAGKEVPNSNVNDVRLVKNVFSRGIETAANTVV